MFLIWIFSIPLSLPLLTALKNAYYYVFIMLFFVIISSQATLKKAKDWYRIRVCMWMIGATVAASVVMIIIGKRDAAAGETISKRGMEWQTRMRQQGLKEEAERDAAAAAKN